MFETILFEEKGPVAWLTLNRPEDGNMFTPVMCREVRDCIELIRNETRTRVMVLTGAGDKFFCIVEEKTALKQQHFIQAWSRPSRCMRRLTAYKNL